MQNLFKFSCIFITGISSSFCSIALYQPNQFEKNVSVLSEIEFIGWQNDDSTLTSKQLSKLYTEYDGKKFYIDEEAKCRDEKIYEYFKESETVQSFGKLIFVDGKLEQKKIATIDYRRPDGSLYKVENVPFQSEFQEIPHAVTYSNGAWSQTANTFKQGTFKLLNGCFAVVDENILTKYQADGTVIRRLATPEEFTAFAPTKMIPHYHKIRHFFETKNLLIGSIEVLKEAPFYRYDNLGHGFSHDKKFLNTYTKMSVNWGSIMGIE